MDRFEKDRRTGLDKATATAVIVGRPNVGKSTLFNRLCESRRAITSPVEGTTRDWIEGACYWNGHVYRVVDTGGYAPGSEDVLSSVRAQVETWIQRADVVIWVVDAGQGLTPPDREFARLLRPMADRVVLTVNKADDPGHDPMAGEFARLGFSRFVTVSASHGRRVSSLLDLMESLTTSTRESSRGAASVDWIRVAIVGRPNVGKSSLTNRLLGEERMIVSPVPGTTRDTIDAQLVWRDKSFLLVDTAGLRAKKSKADDLEGLTRIMTDRALERCDVALLLVDAREGLTEGDVAVGRLIHEKNRACVVGINKWDLVEDHAPLAKHFRARAPEGMPFLTHSPLVFLSAKTGHHVDELLSALATARDEFLRRFDNDDLTAFFWKAVQERPYAYNGRKMSFYTAVQAAVAPPTFILRSNLPADSVHFSYQRHLEKIFRDAYGLSGSPLVLKFKRGHG